MHCVPDGPLMAIDPEAEEPDALTVPSGLEWLVALRPVMMVGGTVTVGEHTTLKLAPPSSGPVVDPLRFSIRRPPPTVKQAGPALRLLAWEVEGAEVVLAKLQN